MNTDEVTKLERRVREAVAAGATSWSGNHPLEPIYRALLARAEAAEAEAAEARATNEALAELAASETERRVALAERVAELEAALASADDETASASAQAARFWRTNNKLAERVAELEAERALLIADVCRVGKETCPYCGITLASGKCEECDWPRRYSLELETAAKVFAAPPPDAPTEPTP